MPAEIPTLLSLPQFAAKHPAFPVSALRWLRYRAADRGLTRAFVTVGRRVYIDEREFFNAVREQQAS